MAITNPEAIRFVNEQVRPLCERVRALMAEISAMRTVWDSGVSSSFSNNVDIVEDGRETEGVSRLTALNVTQALSIMGNMSAANNSEIISKPCVRPLAAG